MVVSFGVTAVNHLSIDTDDGAISGRLGTRISIASEVQLSGLSEVL